MIAPSLRARSGRFDFEVTEGDLAPTPSSRNSRGNSDSSQTQMGSLCAYILDNSCFRGFWSDSLDALGEMNS